jgi:hypothetical protein
MSFYKKKNRKACSNHKFFLLSRVKKINKIKFEMSQVCMLFIKKICGCCMLSYFFSYKRTSKVQISDHHEELCLIIFLFVKSGDNRNLSSGKGSQFVSGFSSASLIGTLQ